MITLWLNALDHHHRLVIALNSPPIIMHDTTKSRGLYGLNGRLIMNGEWWKVVNDQWYKQVTTTYACNTMNTIPLSMLHLFFKHFVLLSIFLLTQMPLAYISTLCFPFSLFFYLGLRPYYFFFSFAFSWPLATSLFFFFTQGLSASFISHNVACFTPDTTIQS